MDRWCVAREIGEDGGIWSCLNVSGLWVELIGLLAIMEVSAHAILLADKPLSGCSGHQFSRAPGRPLLHFFLSLSQTSVGKLGLKSTCSWSFLISHISFVRPRRRLSPAPTAGSQGRRAQMRSRLAAFSGHRQARP